MEETRGDRNALQEKLYSMEDEIQYRKEKSVELSRENEEQKAEVRNEGFLSDSGYILTVWFNS